VFEQLVNSRAVTISLPHPPPLVVLDRMLLACINFCIYAMLRTRATFSWPALYYPGQTTIDITHAPNPRGLNFQDEGNCEYVIKSLRKDMITFNVGSVTTAQLAVVGEIAYV